MSSKKEVSLLGRKRTKDLEPEQMQQDIKQDKKEALRAMIDQESHQELHQELHQDMQPVSQVAPQEISPPLGVAAVYEKEVKAAVNMLIKMHTQMREAGTSNRREYSFYEQNKRLVNELRNLLAEKADFYESKGLDDDDNRRACQQYINDVREGLRAVGIFMNYLEVRPVKNPV